MEIYAKSDSERGEVSSFSQLYPGFPTSIGHFARQLDNSLYQNGLELPDVSIVFVPKIDHLRVQVSVDPPNQRWTLYVGLSQSSWNELPIQARRKLLADACLTALAELRDVKEETSVLTQVRAVYEKEYECLREDQYHDFDVPLRNANASSLSVPAWSCLALDQRLSEVRKIRRSLASAGHQFEPFEVKSIEIGATVHSILVTRNIGIGIEFTFVPGGNCEVGYDEARMAQLDRLYQNLSAGNERPDLSIYKRRDPLPVAPMLVASEPICSDTRGIEAPFQITQLPPPIVSNMADRIPILMPWHEAFDILRENRWSIPSSIEFEWAVRGSQKSLFYWGDDPLRIILEGTGNTEAAAITGIGQDGSRTLVDFACRSDSVRRVPEWNALGLRKPLSYQTWCKPVCDLDEPHPLITRGGAATWWPWQGCDEWMSFLCAYEQRLDLEAGDTSASIRPIIRIRT